MKIKEDRSRTAVLVWGRMNPPTISHKMLVDKAKSIPGDLKVYLSHTQDKKKNPLSYEQKVYWAKKAFGNVVESEAKTIVDVLHELSSQGYDNLVYVGGEDRIGGDEDITELILKYNGKSDKSGNIPYTFSSIDFINAGHRDENSDDLVEKASASLARQYVKENDFENFCKIEPFDEYDCADLFNELKEGLGIKYSIYQEDYLTEAPADDANSSKFEQGVTDKLNELSDNDFERQGSGNLVADIKCTTINNKDVFFIECKNLPSQAGEIRCQINADGSLSKANSYYEITDDTKEYHELDQKLIQNILDEVNSSVDIRNTISNSSSKLINIALNKLEDTELSNKLIDLMKNRIVSHYNLLGAEYIAFGKTAEQAKFCKLEDMWEALTITQFKLRLKLAFSYAAEAHKYRSVAGDALKSHISGILYDEDYGTSVDDGFIEKYIADDRLLFYSMYLTHNGATFPKLLTLDDNCFLPGHGDHLKFILPSNIAFDVTQDREKVKGSAKREDSIITVGDNKYMRFAVRPCPNRFVISFLVTLNEKKDNTNYVMTYDEFVKSID